MKKGLFSIVVTLCMVLNFLPAETLAVTPQAQWGVAGDDGAAPAAWTTGTLTNAIAYANGLSEGTAYIQLLADIDKDNHTIWPLTFDTDKTTILDLNGKDIDRGLTEAIDGGNVITVKGTMTLKDSSTDTVADQGRITGGNSSSATGGGVLVNSSSFTMQGGNITGNRNTNDSQGGGGVLLNGNGSFSMQGGSIANNEALNWGGGVYSSSSGDFTMTGGSITGNKSAQGGVFSYSSISLGGTAVIQGNMTTTTAPVERNVVLYSTKISVISEKPLTSGAAIGVTDHYNQPISVIPVDITNPNSADYSSYFFSDNSQFRIRNGSDNKVQLALYPLYGTITTSNANTSAVGDDNPITITVKNTSNNKIEASFDGIHDVTITGLEAAPDGTYGSFNGTALTSDAAGAAGQVIPVAFTDGVAIADLTLHKADTQTIRFTVADVNIPGTNTVTLSPTPGTTASMEVDQDIIAPASNGGVFAQQPKIVLKDAYGNKNTNDSSTVITVSKKDAGTWTLTGTKTVKADAGVVTFTGLGATNRVEVTGAYLAFNGGNLTEVTSMEITLPAPQSSGGGSSGPTTETKQNFVEIIVNGKIELAATSSTSKEGNQTVTTVVIDDKKIEEKLQAEGNNAIVIIPVKHEADVVIGQLNGQTVKNMENKEAVLEIKTDAATYMLPASQINIDNISEKFGEQVALKDINVQVKISTPSQETMKIVEDTANKNDYKVVVNPIDFNITGSVGDKKVEVSRFNTYVERLLPIPVGADPSKITTGIVVNPEGTSYPVPTQIVQIDGIYFAKINSLTNSTYFVVWNPKEFPDVANHWAKDSINNLGSRMVIRGFNENTFAPNQDITRAQFTAIIVRGLGLKTGIGENQYSDVVQDEWYTEYIKTATDYNLISGYGNGQFGPNDKITRQQAMAIIARAMKLTNLCLDLEKAEVNSILAKFSDSKQIADFFEESIALLIKSGIVKGQSNQTIAPNDNITRAEVAVIIERLLKTTELID